MELEVTFHPVWISSIDCQGPPDSVFKFMNGETDTPVSFSFTIGDYPHSLMYVICGYSPVAMNAVGCCWSSWDTSQTTYSSYMISKPSIDSDEMFEYWMPVEIIGSGYCYFGVNGTAGLVERWVLDDGACQDNSVSCQNGVLTLWDVNVGCGSGVSESYGANFYGTIQTSNLLHANMSVGYKHMEAAGQVIKWIGVMPGENLYITYNTPSRVFGAVIVGFGIMASLIGFVWYAYKLVTTRTGFFLVCLINQVLLTTALVLLVTMNSQILLTDWVFFNFLETSSAIKAFSSLTLLYLNAYALIQMNLTSVYFNTRFKQACIYVFFLAAHLCLTWQSYDRIGYKDVILELWDVATTPIWFLLCLIANNSCVGALVYLITKSTLTLEKTSKQINALDVLYYLVFEARFSCFLLIMCLINTTFYITVSVLTNYSNALGYDVDYMNATEVAFVAFPVNSLLTLAILQVEKNRKRTHSSAKQTNVLTTANLFS